MKGWRSPLPESGKPEVLWRDGKTRSKEKNCALLCFYGRCARKEGQGSLEVVSSYSRKVREKRAS